MHWYQSILLAGAVIAAALAWNVPRAVLWISLGALSFLASSWWHDAGLPYGAGFGAATNFVICLTLYRLGTQLWEIKVAKCFIAMILVDVLYLIDMIPSHFLFAISLEALNWLALAFIAARGITERMHSHGLFSGRFNNGWAHSLDRALREERGSRPPWWEIP